MPAKVFACGRLFAVCLGADHSLPCMAAASRTFGRKGIIFIRAHTQGCHRAKLSKHERDLEGSETT